MFNNEFLLKPCFRSVYKFDGTSWTTLPSLNVARASPAVVVVNSRILVIGGISTSQAPSDKIEMFDGEKWNLISVLPEALMEKVELCFIKNY